MYSIALILVLGVSAQWIAWRLRVPSILLLLAFGFLAGPVTHRLNPAAMPDHLLEPVISISVALILFEGGMSLKRSELRLVGRVVRNLATVGALSSGVMIAVIAHYLMHLPWALASLLGAILLVTGPTVVGPLLRHVRPMGQLGPILKWEGILIDPIGAMFAVLVFEAVQSTAVRHAAPVLLNEAFKTLGVGVGLGLGFAGLMIFVFRRRWVPDHLQNPVSLMAVIGAFVSSNAIQHESGLFTVTMMGIAIANQKSVLVQHIAEFKEVLSVLLIATLFIVIGAGMNLEQVKALGWKGPVFVASLILIVRPASVFLSTIGSGLSWQQKTFLSAMAPRGIVAAAVSSVFALRFLDLGVGKAELLEPIVITVIVGTVLVYGLGAKPLGRLLGVAWPNAQGCLIVGSHPLGRAIGNALQESNCPVLMVDTNRWNVQQARLEGLPSFLGSVVSGDVMERVELGGLGRLLALTSNDEVNSLAALNFARVFGRSEVYQLASGTANTRIGEVARDLRGRPLFTETSSYARLNARFDAGATIRKTKLSEAFGPAQFRQLHGDAALPMFLVSNEGEVTVISADQPDVITTALPGRTIVYLTEDAANAVGERS